MNRRILTLLSAIALSAALTQAQDKPNFSGSWKLNVAKSDFGPLPGPEKMDRTITHGDPDMSIHTVQSGPQGDATTDTKYKTDGSDVTNKMRGQDIKTVAKWDGAKLTVKYKFEAQGAEISIVDVWSLAAGGQQMTVVSSITAPQGEFARTMLFDKQAGAAPSSDAAKATSGKPNFSGEWKLLVDKSDFGPAPAPKMQTLKIDHQEPAVVTTTDSDDDMNGKTTTVIKYKTDGTAATNDIRGNKAVSTAKWDGEAIVVNTKLDYQGMDLTLNNTMKIAGDGKTMNTVIKITLPQGDLEQKLVYERVR